VHSTHQRAVASVGKRGDNETGGVALQTRCENHPKAFFET
jgi:hypothetical protein